MDWKVVQYALYVRYMNRHKKVPDWTFAAPRTTADVDARGRRARGRPLRASGVDARAASGVDARAVGERERERERSGKGCRRERTLERGRWRRWRPVEER